MLKPENVPECVWRAAMSAYHKTLRKNPAMAWQEAVVAALGAWPDAERFVNRSPYDDDETWPHIILPLPTETTNAET